jgi:SNF2 family DNA or RNA helicase
MNYDDRSKVIAKFVKDPLIRVLFFSSVGATGLNLSIANIVIFLVFIFYLRQL